jgi:hypothetical protein
MKRDHMYIYFPMVTCARPAQTPRSSVKNRLFSPVPLLPNVSLQRNNFVIINRPHFGLEIVRQGGDTHMIKIIKSKYAEDVLLISVCMIACLGLYFLAAYFFATFF